MRSKLPVAFALTLLACTSEVADSGDPCSEAGAICSFMGNGIAGLGHDGMPPLEVSLYLPQDLLVMPDGQPYVLDWNNHRVRTLEAEVVETVVGTGELGEAPDGPAIETSLNHPTHLAIDPEGKLILSAWHNSKVMRFDPRTGDLTTLCGDRSRNDARARNMSTFTLLSETFSTCPISR
jgi:hypothetical protein